nr:hypothetical protein [Tanacetum cinerariifolium]
MVTDLEDSKTHTVGGVWSGEYMDHSFTESMTDLDRCYTMLQELRSMDVGRALIHKNCEGSKHEGRRIAMVPPKVTPQLPKPEVKVEEKIMKAKTCEEIMGFNNDEDVKGFNCELKTDFKCVHDLNIRDFDSGLISRMIIKNYIKFSTRKSIKDKVRREKVFEVDEAFNIENSRASSFQVKKINVDETKINRFKIGLHLRYCPRFLFAIGKHYNELVTCDVIVIEACLMNPTIDRSFTVC